MSVCVSPCAYAFVLLHFIGKAIFALFPLKRTLKLFLFVVPLRSNKSNMNGDSVIKFHGCTYEK